MLTLEQRHKRMRGLSGTDHNNLFAPRRSANYGPISVFHDKTSPPRAPSQDEDTPDTFRGKYLEPGALRWYADTQVALLEEPGTLVHPGHPGSDTEPAILATPDGVASFMDRPRRAVEVKCPRFSMSLDWCDGEWPHDIAVPAYYYPQVQIEAYVTGTCGTDVVALLGDEFRIIYVPLDMEYVEEMLYLGRKFWRDHVLANKPPEPDGTNAYADYLSERFPRAAQAPLMEATDEARAFARTYAAQSEVIKRAEAERRVARQHLEAILQDAPGIDLGDEGKVTWKNNADKPRVDYDALLQYIQVAPHIVEKFTTIKPGPRVFRASLK